jgi:hypothetical protein
MVMVEVMATGMVATRPVDFRKGAHGLAALDEAKVIA